MVLCLLYLTCAFFHIIVKVYPEEQLIEAIRGCGVSFYCTLETANFSNRVVGVQWLVNGTQLENLHLMNVTEGFTTVGIGLGMLNFTNLPVSYNMTRIQCNATLTSGETSLSTNSVVLLIFPGAHCNSICTIII